jgi:hypothetical protein
MAQVVECLYNQKRKRSHISWKTARVDRQKGVSERDRKWSVKTQRVSSFKKKQEVPSVK